MTTTNDIDARCPTCDSPAPNLHPAVQSEGEVQPCADPFHAPSETGKLRAELADVRAKYQDALWTASQHAAKVNELTAELAKTGAALTEANRQRTVAEATTEALKRDNEGYAAQVEQMRAVVEAAEPLIHHVDTIRAKWATLLPRDVGESLLALAAALAAAVDALPKAEVAS